MDLWAFLASFEEDFLHGRFFHRGGSLFLSLEIIGRAMHSLLMGDKAAPGEPSVKQLGATMEWPPWGSPQWLKEEESMSTVGHSLFATDKFNLRFCARILAQKPQNQTLRQGRHAPTSLQMMSRLSKWTFCYRPCNLPRTLFTVTSISR